MAENYGHVSVFSSEALTVSGGATPSATSNAIRITSGSPDALIWNVTASAGTPDMKFEYAASDDDSNYTSYIACFGSTGAASEGDFANTSAINNQAVVALSPAQYYKFKITNSDAADTMTVTCKLRIAEDV